MKVRFSLFTSILFILATTFATSSLYAQRRTGNSTIVKQRNENEINSEDKKRQKESKTKDSGKVISSESTAGRRTSVSRQQPAVAAKPGSTATGRSSAHIKSSTNTRQSNLQPNAAQRGPVNAKQTAIRQTPPSNRSNVELNNPADARARADHNRTVYRIDTKDKRYTPAKNFKGNKNNWSAKQVTYHVHYKKREAEYYNYYDHRKYKHWDNTWENYRWNVNSWRDYYYGYHPQSYRFHKHYTYHPGYGHVIRKFNYKPVYFIHNNIRYYNYNGHFFRHFKGVGYVLVDMPYGLVFNRLPSGYERVYINGFLYFRVGNLFFESNPHGYALIHYPERYYALESNYYNGGYYKAVDFSIRY